MKTNKITRRSPKGFTLIELLVVVLIIGVLAAVAVPQYKVAVARSRITTILPLVKNIQQAQEVYYLNTGIYSPHIKNLGINIPCNVDQTDPRVTTFYCDPYIWVYMSPNYTTVSYCPKNTGWASCWNIKDLEIEFYNQHSPSNAGVARCMKKNGSALGTKICNSLTLQ